MEVSLFCVLQRCVLPGWGMMLSTSGTTSQFSPVRTDRQHCVLVGCPRSRPGCHLILLLLVANGDRAKSTMTLSRQCLWPGCLLSTDGYTLAGPLVLM